MNEEPKLSVPASMAMKSLLADSSLTKPIVPAFYAIQKILYQTAQDITTEENRDKIGPTILAIKHVNDMISLFEARGRAEIAKENSKNNNTR